MTFKNEHYDVSNRNIRTVDEWVQYFKDRIIPLNPEWTNLSETDIGILMVRMMGSIGDELNWRMDRAELEFFLDSVVERANAQSILNLIGYSMSTYKSGHVTVRVSGSEGPLSNAFTLPKYTRFSSSRRSSDYHLLDDITIPPNVSNIEFLVYEGNYSNETHMSTVIDTKGRIYLDNSTGAISENTVSITYDSITELTRVDDIYTTTEVKQFQLMVDNYGYNYIQLDTNWRSYINTVTPTPLFIEYLVKEVGTNGNVGFNTLDRISIYPDFVDPEVELTMTNITTTSGGDSPESIESARINAPKYARSMATYVTLRDYEDGIELADPRIEDAQVVDINTPGMGITEPYELRCFVLMKDRDMGVPNELEDKLKEVLDSKRMATITYTIESPTPITLNLELRCYYSEYPVSRDVLDDELVKLISDHLRTYMIGQSFSPSKLSTLIHNEFKYRGSLNYVSLGSTSVVNVGAGQVIKLNNLDIINEIG